MSVSPFSLRPALRTWAVGCLLFLGTWFLFDRSSSFGFLLYDDPSYITNNDHVKAGLTWAGVVWAFTGHTDYWHPLTWLSHMIDWELYDRVPYGHHLTSIGWHALNAVLVFIVLRRLTGSYWRSAFAAALFAWHPLRIESVAWITERKDVMSGCFFLLTLWAYAAYVTRRSAATPAWPHYLLTLACFILGLMSKPMVVSLPIVLLLLDFWPLRRANLSAHLWATWRPLLTEKLPFVALSAIASVVTIVMQTSHGAFTLDLPFAARLGNAAVSIARYLGKFFWPFDLAVFYPHPGYWPLALVAAAALLTVVLSCAAWQQRLARPWLLTGWLWFLVVLLPVIGLIQVGMQAMADRYTYLSLLGIELALLWSLPARVSSTALRPLLAVGAGLILAFSAARTWQHQAVWKDSVTLFRHAVAATDKNDAAHAYLAYILAGENRIEEAEIEANQSLALNPENDIALFALADVRENQRRLPEAAELFKRVLAKKPEDTLTRFRLGLVLLNLDANEARPHLVAAARAQKNWRDAAVRFGFRELRKGDAGVAATFFNVALEAEPKDVDAHFGLTLAYAKLGRPDDALPHLETLAGLKPDFAPARMELGLAKLARGDATGAAEEFRAAISAAPTLARAHLGLARAVQQLGRAADATTSLERALQLAPEDPAVLRAWAVSLARNGRFADAATHYRRALAASPADASLHAELGFALLLSQQRDAAIRHFEEALRLDPNLPGIRERLQRLRN